MQQQWYVELDGVADGPHDRHVLVQMRTGGRVHGGTRVWRAGFSDWTSYADAGLDEPAAPPPSVSRIVAASVENVAQSSLAFDLSADTPPVDPALEHERVMRRMIAERRAARDPADTAESLPARAPRLEVEDDGWQWVQPAPWRRYLARMLDVSLLGVFTWMVVGIVAAATSGEVFNTLFHVGGLLKVPLLSSMVVMGSLIPVQALLIGLSGTTIGKWIFGIRITRRDGSAIGFRAALGRELYVFCLGAACGAPFLTLLTALIAYNVLTKTGCTQWDRGKDWVVTQREPGEAQTAMFVLGIVTLMAVVMMVQHFQSMAK